MIEVMGQYFVLDHVSIVARVCKGEGDWWSFKVMVQGTWCEYTGRREVLNLARAQLIAALQEQEERRKLVTLPRVPQGTISLQQGAKGNG